MSEYREVAKTPKQSRPQQSVCGDCGKPVAKRELICKNCVEDAQLGFLVTGLKFAHVSH